jgi:S1-C subfamily serine protease
VEEFDDIRVPTPEAVPGRHHIVVQTDNYLEDLRHININCDFGTQTEADLDRPEPILFEPKSSGLDMFTFIEENDLFDFDQEVQVILNVISEKSLDQALKEVLEEEELKDMQDHADAFNQIRNVKLVELQRLHAKDVRFESERERRIAQAASRVDGVAEELARAAASSAAKDYVMNLQDEVLTKLAGAGYFYDPTLKQVQNTFLPWLVQRVGDNNGKVKAAEKQVDNLVLNAVGVLQNEVSDNLRDIKRKVIGAAQTTRDNKAVYEARVKEVEELKAKREQERIDKIAADAAEAAVAKEAAAAEAAAKGENTEGEGDGEGGEAEAAKEGDGEGDEGDEVAVKKVEVEDPELIVAPLVVEEHNIHEFGYLALAHAAAPKDLARLLEKRSTAVNLFSYASVLANEGEWWKASTVLDSEVDLQIDAATLRQRRYTGFERNVDNLDAEVDLSAVKKAIEPLSGGSVTVLVPSSPSLEGLTPTLGLTASAAASNGVYVVAVAGQGGAVHAELVVGDVVTEIDGVGMMTPDALMRFESSLEPGQVVRMTVTRGLDGRQEMLSVETWATSMAQTQVREIRTKLGKPTASTPLLSAGKALTALMKIEARVGFRGIAGDGGLTVEGAESGGPGYRAGMVDGDTIVSFGGIACTDSDALLIQVKAKLGGEWVSIALQGTEGPDARWIEVGGAGSSTERLRSLRAMAGLKDPEEPSFTKPCFNQEAVEPSGVGDSAALATLQAMVPSLGFTYASTGLLLGAGVGALTADGVYSTLMTGDLITKVDETDISTDQDLAAVEAQCTAGDVLKVLVVRLLDQREDLVSLEVGSAGGEGLAAVRVIRGKTTLPTSDSVLHDKASALELLRKMRPVAGFRINDEENGIVSVTDVPEHTAGARAGIQTDDQLASVDGVVIASSEDFVAAMSSHTAGNVLKLEVLRGGVPVALKLELAARNDAGMDNPVEHVRCLRYIAGLPVVGLLVEV